MKKTSMFYGPLFAALLLSACVVQPAHDHDNYVVAPALPVIVELGVEPYFFHSGFYYYYQERDQRWSYSRDRTGPWQELPRDHYPREIKHKDRGHKDGGHDRGYR